ncbi:hypothetical protein SAMN04488007_3638 [Maribacter aquivivus]|uniref:Uncharacterized protein n=1 Tax=Maribacter aquivivus TaxID=228958 RepID=A0A1M6UGQ5_9FLAO|nr:hypothetical protein [Maribacter aquivivus]SHK68412.1 hypothetical protein SAMN04488007_3638 [Maribacter aquivivus]
MELAHLTSNNDSLKSEMKDFMDNNIVELITILPKCYTRGYPIFSEDGTERIGRETVENCDYESIIIKNEEGFKNDIVTIKTKYVGQKVKLKKSDYKKVLKIPDNKLSETSETIIVVADCYIPRHGLNFYDSSQRLTGFLEICFECNRYEISGNVPLEMIILGEDLSSIKKVFEEYNLLVK